MSKTWDAIVIGGGAAGLFCAGVAGQLGKRVLVLDHAEAAVATSLICTAVQPISYPSINILLRVRLQGIHPRNSSS